MATEELVREYLLIDSKFNDGNIHSIALNIMAEVYKMQKGFCLHCSGNFNNGTDFLLVVKKLVSIYSLEIKISNSETQWKGIAYFFQLDGLTKILSKAFLCQEK